MAERAEKNRISQITGVIQLIQDAKHTPRFLFYAPFFGKDSLGTGTHFLGRVYAPFIMGKLMKGLLIRVADGVNVRIIDDEDILYDSEGYSDAPSVIAPIITVEEVYGRN